VSDECYFLSIKLCYHCLLLLGHVVAPEGAVFCLDVLLTAPEVSLTHSGGVRLSLPVSQLSYEEPTP